MVVIDSDGILDIDDLTEDIQAAAPSPADAGRNPAAQLIGHSLEDVEKFYITETLKQTNGNREETAKLLGIGERTLYRKLKEYAIT
ncbi:MAG: sigma-54-dependent Fis family transcriptional regulator, partial [Planctomycetia bacterium]|nr:sigma-54-dependent Fis family transcriptional regulator [Planctomycetia bacterium]